MSKARKAKTNFGTLLLLLVIGGVVFWTRGGGSEAENWRALLVTLGILAALVAVKGIRAWVVSRRNRGGSDGESGRRAGS